MGSLCSKSSNHSGGHTVLGPEPTNQGGAPRVNDPDPRAAAAAAAELRLQAVSCQNKQINGTRFLQLCLYLNRLKEEAPVIQIRRKANFPNNWQNKTVAKELQSRSYRKGWW